MPIQYLYPNTINIVNSNDYTWYSNGSVLTSNGENTDEIDEGFSTVNYSDFLQSKIIFNSGFSDFNILSTNMTRNYIVPSSIICNISCSSIFQNFRPLSTYYSGKNLTVNVRNQNNGELVAFGGTGLDSGLLNLSFPLNILSRQIAPTDYKVDITFSNDTSPVDFNDYFYPRVYAFELVTSGTIQAKESGIPLTILGGLDTNNLKRLLAFDDNSGPGFSFSYQDADWNGYVFSEYAECYHRYDVSGIFNTAYFQFNEGSGNVIFSGNKSGQIFSEDNKYRWLTDGAITDSNALIEQEETGLSSAISSGQYIDNNQFRTITQGAGLYLGPTKQTIYTNTNYRNETLSILQGVDFYNTLISSGNFSLYLNMGYRLFNQTTVDNDIVFDYDAGCTLISHDTFETTIRNGLLITRDKSTGFNTYTDVDTNLVINSLVHTYNSGLLTTYILYEDETNWRVSSGTIPNINLYGNFQLGRSNSLYQNYHDLTMHQLGISDYAFSSTELNTLLEKINAPVNNVILNNGVHSEPTYTSGDVWVGVSYQKSVKNSNDKTHLLTNRIIFNDNNIYSIPSSGYVIMDAYVAYTGNNPSGYLGITATSAVDGNNINPLWNDNYNLYDQKVFNSGGIQKVTIIDSWEDTNPYPFAVGANTPQVNILVTTPMSNSFYDGGEFRLYGLEFYTDSSFYVEPTGNVDGITLYTYGSLPSSGSITLFLGQDENVDSLNLFVKANEPVPVNDNISLYILNGGSGTVTDYCTLYTEYVPEISGTLPLYIEGGGTDYRNGTVPLIVCNQTETSSLPLFIKAKSGTSVTGNVGLSIYSSDNSGLFGSIPLLLLSDNFNSYINLYVSNNDANSNIASLNLIVGNDTTSNGTCTLFACNNNGLVESGVNFYIGGDGINDGAFVGTGSMNLFINREYESIANGIPFNIAGPSGIISSVPFVTSGGNIVNNNCTLVLPISLGIPSGYITLFNHGF